MSINFRELESAAEIIPSEVSDDLEQVRRDGVCIIPFMV